MSRKSFKIKRAVFGVIYVLLALFAVIQACLPSETSSSVSEVFTEVASSAVFGEQVSEVSVLNEKLSFSDFASFLRKLVGHFGLFSAMGLFGFLYLFKQTKTRKAVLIDLSATISIAIVTETIQYFMPSRIGALSDVILDAQGAVSAVSIAVAIISLQSRIKRGKKRKHIAYYVLIPALVFATLFLLFNPDTVYMRFCFILYATVCIVSDVTTILANS